MNAVLIYQGLSAPERLAQLYSTAIRQMPTLIGLDTVGKLRGPHARKVIEP